MNFQSFYLANQINFWLPQILFVIILSILLGSYLKFKKIPNRLLNWSLLVVLFLIICQFAAKGLLFYLSLKNDQTGLGRYLLPGYSPYFFKNLWYLSYQPLATLTSALILFIFFSVLRKVRAEILDFWEVKEIALLSLICGWPRLFFWLFASLVLFLISKFYLLFKGKGISFRTSITPFLLIAALLTLIFFPLVDKIFLLLNLNL